MRLQLPIRTRLTGFTISLVALLAFLGMVEAVVAILFPNARYIVPPSAVIGRYELLFTTEMAEHIFGTLLRTVVGFGIAGILGISFGVLLGRSRISSLIFDPIVNLFRPIPSSILIPLLTLIPVFGYTQRTHYFTIIFGGVWPILIYTIDAVRSPHPTALQAIRQFKLSRLNRLRFFTLPQASVAIFSGLKVSLSICFILSITAELLVSVEIFGLGYYQESMGKDGNYPLMYLITAVVACLGFFLNFLLSRLEFIHPWLKHNCDEGLLGKERKL